MKTQYGFTRFDTLKEFKDWLTKQPKYNYNGLQVHHTYMPSYTNFYKADGSHEDELTRQYNMKQFHVNTNHWGDIAQHFTIFPNGKIVTGRKLSNTQAIGIRGWNSNKICIEIYGNFDKGKDKMKPAQKEAVICAYGELAKKFGISINTSHIRPHCWFTASGTYLGKYNSSRSAKTCPGTNFWGVGCSTSGFNKFLADVKTYVNGKAPVEEKPKETKVNKEGKVNVPNSTLNVRKSYDADSTKLGELKDNAKVEIVATVSNGWLKIKYKDGYGYVNSKYVDGIKDVVVEKPKEETPTKKETYYRVVIGSYGVRDNAVDEQKKAISKGYKDTFLVADTVDGKQLFRVVVDSFKLREDADRLVAELEGKGFDPFISIYEK